MFPRPAPARQGMMLQLRNLMVVAPALVRDRCGGRKSTDCKIVNHPIPQDGAGDADPCFPRGERRIGYRQEHGRDTLALFLLALHSYPDSVGTFACRSLTKTDTVPLSIQIRKSDFTEKPFTFEFKEKDGRPHIVVSSTVFEPHKMTVEAQREIKEKLFELLVT
jgi:hypothetical protein